MAVECSTIHHSAMMDSTTSTHGGVAQCWDVERRAKAVWAFHSRARHSWVHVLAMRVFFQCLFQVFCLQKQTFSVIDTISSSSSAPPNWIRDTKGMCFAEPKALRKALCPRWVSRHQPLPADHFQHCCRDWEAVRMKQCLLLAWNIWVLGKVLTVPCYHRHHRICECWPESVNLSRAKEKIQVGLSSEPTRALLRMILQRVP